MYLKDDEMLHGEGCYNYDEDQDDDDKVEILHMPDIPESRILSIPLSYMLCMCTVKWCLYWLCLPLV